jgi:outer membrane phospholipase A
VNEAVLRYRHLPGAPNGRAEWGMVKFQFSFKYLIYTSWNMNNQVYFGFTDLIFWDLWNWDGYNPVLKSTSAKVLESNLSGQLWYQKNIHFLASVAKGWVVKIPLVQAEFYHLSNGEQYENNRSLFRFGASSQISLQNIKTNNRFKFQGIELLPGVYKYFWLASDNKDAVNYMGFSKLVFVAGFGHGTVERLSASPLQLEARLGFGRRGSSSSLGFKFLLSQNPKFSPYFYAQYWNGYGESLINYNQYSRHLRFGFQFLL